MLLRGVVVVHTESPATGVEGNSAVSRLKTSESARGRGDGDAFSGHVSSKLASKGLQARPAPISHRAAVGVHGLEAVEFACGAPKVVESNIAVGGLLCASGDIDVCSVAVASLFKASPLALAMFGTQAPVLLALEDLFRAAQAGRLHLRIHSLSRYCLRCSRRRLGRRYRPKRRSQRSSEGGWPVLAR
jgi:hypothetical protein